MAHTGARSACSCASASPRFGLILFQAALGGLTVEEGLKQELVATHLGVAMLQIGLVLLMGRLGGPEPVTSAEARRHARACGSSRPSRSWRCWRRSWPAATCRRASCTAPASSTARSTRTWRAATSSPPAAASSCRSAAARRSTSTSRTARSCIVTVTRAARPVRDRRAPAPAPRPEPAAAELSAPRLGTIVAVLLLPGAARRGERLGRRARLADRRPPGGRERSLWVSLVLFAFR